MKMIAGLLLVFVAGLSVGYGGYTNRDDCYRYLDHTAKYKLCHDDRGYPTNEINLVLESYPSMKEMFYEDKYASTSPITPYTNPPTAVCPHERFTLYSFFYANKDCYVIYPNVQRITYVQCSPNNSYDCQRCAGYGGVSKCVEDYDFQHVWAYCTREPEVQVRPRLTPDPTFEPRPVYRQPAQESIFKYDTLEAVTQPPRPTLQVQQKRRLVIPYANAYMDPWNKMYRPYIIQHRWKRSYDPAPKINTVERVKLYLPHNCGCKNFVC